MMFQVGDIVSAGETVLYTVCKTYGSTRVSVSIDNYVYGPYDNYTFTLVKKFVRPPNYNWRREHI